MKRMFALAGIASLLFGPQASADDPVIDWDEIAVTVMLKAPGASRSILTDLVYVHVAIYDAVNAIDRGDSVFAVDPPNAAPWAVKEVAVAAAARRVLATLYPSQAAFVDSVFNVATKPLPPLEEVFRGFAIGDTVAALLLALRAGDGRDVGAPYDWKSAAPGVYQPTPPGAAQYQPVGMWNVQFRPFVLDSASALRAPDPPALTSELYARDFNEVKRYGSRDSSFTTAEQREIARFHTENPNLLLARNIRDIARAKGLSLPEQARYFAQIYLTISDALTAGFESKYFHNFWRPVTAIRAAAGDGNPSTDWDYAWLPLVTTPVHPEYPAAHGCGMGGLAFALREFFGTSDITFTLSSRMTGTSHSFSTTDDLVTEVINARVWGGMHFRNSVETGMFIAREVAERVAKRFKPATSVSIQQLGGIARDFRLEQNYPNPFNPSTVIRFSIPPGVSSAVTLRVYNMLGQEVRTMVNDNLRPGSYEATFDATGLATGAYFYRLVAGSFVQTKRLMLIR